MAKCSDRRTLVFLEWCRCDEKAENNKDRPKTIEDLGDSITDGRNSTTDGNGRWPDDLARRLQHGKHTVNIGVLNQGIGGNRLLHDGLGPNALARFDRDVLAQTGVHWLILFEGVNDIGTCQNECDQDSNARSKSSLPTSKSFSVLIPTA